MNCGEAVKPRQYTVEAARKQVLNRNSAHSEWETWLSALIRANPWRKDPQKTNAAPDQPSGAASFVDLSSCLPAARGGESTVLVRQRSPRVPLLPVLAAEP